MIDQVYVVHYSPLQERKNKLIEALRKAEIADVEWIECEIEEGQLSEYYQPNQQQWYQKLMPLSYSHHEPYRELKKSELSIAAKHLKVYENILQNKYETSLILEDDVVFEKDLKEKIGEYLEKTPADWDLIFIGSGCNLRIPENKRSPGKVAYLKEHPATKCLDSYLVRHAAVEKFYNTLRPISLPMDFEMNYHLLINNLKCYWWEPPIVRQGSQCGLYDSEIGSWAQ